MFVPFSKIDYPSSSGDSKKSIAGPLILDTSVKRQHIAYGLVILEVFFDNDE